MFQSATTTQGSPTVRRICVRSAAVNRMPASFSASSSVPAVMPSGEGGAPGEGGAAGGGKAGDFGLTVDFGPHVRQCQLQLFLFGQQCFALAFEVRNAAKVGFAPGQKARDLFFETGDAGACGA